MKITVDPNTDSSGFDYVEKGLQRLRVVACTPKEGANYPYLAWELELTDPNVKGVAGKKPGHVFENTTLKPGDNAQFRLRQVCDSLGLDWGDFDTEDVRAMELDAHLDTEEYQGVMKNIVAKFVPLKK